MKTKEIKELETKDLAERMDAGCQVQPDEVEPRYHSPGESFSD